MINVYLPQRAAVQRPVSLLVVRFGRIRDGVRGNANSLAYRANSRNVCDASNYPSNRDPVYPRQPMR